MTSKGQVVADPEVEPKLPKYHIDESWYEREGRSLQFMIESRVEGIELPAPKPSRRRGKTAPRPPSMEDLSRIEGFVNPQLPVMEAVFRLLLVHQNKPLEAEQISQELAERGIGVQDARVIRPESLGRMLDRDTYYGITRYPEG